MATSAIARHNHLSRASSTKFSVVSSSLESNNSASTKSHLSKAVSQEKLYRQITPRKKIDRFGVDKTDYKAYALSSTVFPTAVRATFLAEMQEEGHQHRCGFDIVERRLHDSIGDAAADARVSITASTTRTPSALIAPPNTAAQSMTDRSLQSAPVVAINILERSTCSNDNTTDVISDREAGQNSAVMNGFYGLGNAKDPHSSKTKTAVGSYRDPANNDQYTAVTAMNAGTTESNAAEGKMKIKSKSVSSQDGNIELEDAQGNNSTDKNADLYDKGHDFVLSDKALDTKAERQIAKIKRRLEEEKQRRRKKPTRGAVPRVGAYTSADGFRPINYHWVSREARQAAEKETGGDIRDPMYLNTFFPDERPVRFHKTSLPTVKGFLNRPRPWTVSERNVYERAVAAAAMRGSFHAKTAKSAGAGKSRTLPGSNAAYRAAAMSTGNVARRSLGGSRIKSDYDYDEEDDESDDEDEDYMYFDENGQKIIMARRRPRRGPLLEVRPFLASGADGEDDEQPGVTLGDQRKKLRGKQGCLNSRVKQCVRFVRYRERLDKQGDDRPLKAEPGRYRPMSKTNVKEHRPPNPPPSPDQRMQRSVDAYREYVDNIAMQTKYVTTKSTSGKYYTSQPVSALRTSALRPQTRGVGSSLGLGVLSSLRHDPDSMIVRSVMDSNLPEMSGSPGVYSASPGRQLQSSTLFSKDGSDVGKALDIRRISPKISANRIVAGTRGVVSCTQSPLDSAPRTEETPRWAQITSDDEGGDIDDTTPSNAIVVPMATKSECPSEYSGMVEREEKV